MQLKALAKAGAIASLLTLAVISAGLPPARAQGENPQVKVGLENVDFGFLAPGSTRVIEAPVENLGTSAATVRIEAVDLGTGAEEWLKPEEPEFTLPPRGTRTARIRLEIPSEALPRRHVTGLRFAAAPGDTTPAEGVQVRLVTAFQMLVKFTVPGLRVDLTAADVEQGEETTVVLTLGNYFPQEVEPSAEVEILDERGVSQARYAPEPVAIGPQRVQALRFPWNTSTAAAGNYRVEARVRGEEEVITRSAEFVVGALRGRITSFNVGDTQAGKPLTWGLSVQSEGNRPLDVVVRSTVEDSRGRELFSDERASTVDPFGSADFHFTFSTPGQGFPFSFGAFQEVFGGKTYKVTLSVVYGRDQAQLEGEAFVSTPLFMKLITAIVLALVLGLIGGGAFGVKRGIGVYKRFRARAPEGPPEEEAEELPEEERDSQS